MMVSLKLLLSSLPFLVNAQTWCGKNYMEGSPIVPPGGQFQYPETSDVPLLNLQCSPAVKPYLQGEAVSIIVDSRITFSKVSGAAPLGTYPPKSFEVTAILNGQSHQLGHVQLNSTGTEFSLPTNSLVARKEPYTITCVAKLATQTYETTTQLLYLEPPAKGSVTKQDFKTGSLLVKNGNSWEPIFPIGFYTTFDGYLSFRSDGRTRSLVDVRYAITSVTEQVNMIKDRSNLLLWYTGDEPDGTSDPLNATVITKELINNLDGGGYHPVSLVLNCENYYFAEYSAGADVLMQDTYIPTSNISDYGDCGCDNCKGNFQDISTRVDEFKQRLDLLGRSRSTTVWSVPQAFGMDTYWPRFPTGQEWLVESILGINHGSFGIIPWDDPTSAGIRWGSSALAAAVPRIIQFLATPGVEVTQSLENGVDTAFWQLPGTETSLFLVANTNYQNVSLTLNVPQNTNRVEILNGGATLSGAPGEIVLNLNATATSGWVFEGEVSVKTIKLT
ncbi:hypothetical protein Clacol_003489 [Clathrus columnatus]|uniref:Uncharacterized protein n=1 Tax=Clathrus columnatus TaxID=1419009 RepID=A0AAV5A6Y6_9AGAM|nr:hypothetical protein Clacol_003489 [Clathrus columnatus]